METYLIPEMGQISLKGKPAIGSHTKGARLASQYNNMMNTTNEYNDFDSKLCDTYACTPTSLRQAVTTVSDEFFFKFEQQEALITPEKNLKPKPYRRQTDNSHDKLVFPSTRTKKHYSHRKRSLKPEPQGFGSVFTIPDTFKEFTAKAKEVDMDQFNKLMKDVNDSGFMKPEVLEAVTSAMNMAKKGTQMKDDIVNSTPYRYKLEILLFLFGVWSINKYRSSKEHKAYLLAGLVSVGYALYNVWGKWPQFNNTTESSNPRPQSSITETDAGIRDMLAYLIMTFCMGFSNKDIPTKITQGLISLPKMGDGIEMIIKSIKDTIENIYRWTVKNVMKQEPGRLFNSMFSDVDEVIKEAVAIDIEVSTHQLPNTKETILRIQRVIDQLTTLLREIPRSNKTTSMCNDLFNLMTKMRKRLEHVTVLTSADANIRQEPVSAMFRGKPGTFKTVGMSLIAYDLLYEISTPEVRRQAYADTTPLVYFRRMGDKFWDTYTSLHQITVMDDFGQKTDDSGSETSDFLEWIRAINTAPYSLNMANLPDKGKAYFHSKFVLATTNLNDIAPVSVISSQAVKRRIDFLIQVTPKSEYATNGSFDESKMPVGAVEGGQVTRLGLDMFNYVITGWDNKPLRPDEVLDYQGLKMLLLEKYRIKQRYFQNMQNNIDDIARPWKIRDGILPSDEEGQKVDLDMKPLSPEPQSGIRRKHQSRSSNGEQVWCYCGALQQENCTLTEPPRSNPGSYPESSFSLVVENDVRSKLRTPKKLSFPDELRTVEKELADEILDKYEHKQLMGLLDRCCNADPHIPFSYDTKKVLVCYIYRYGNHFVSLFDNGFPTELDIDQFCFEIREQFYTDGLDVDSTFTKIRDWWSEFSTGAWAWFSERCEFAAGLIKMVGLLGPVFWIPAVATVVLTTIGASAIFGQLCRWFDATFNTNLFPETESIHKQTDNIKIERNAQRIKMSSGTTPRPQLGRDPNGASIMTSVLSSNGYEVHVLNEGNWTKIGFALAIVDRIFLVPFHFITHLYGIYPQDTSVRLVRKNKGNPVIFEMASSVFVNSLIIADRLQENDLVALKLPQCVGQQRDIRKFFCTDNTVSRMTNNMDITLNYPIVDNRSTAYVTSTFEYNLKIKDIDDSTYELRKSIAYYGVTTGKGDCGAVVAWANPKMQTEKIFGMHVAGDTKAAAGWAGLITQEMLEECIVNHIDFITVENIEPQCADILSPFDVVSINERTPKVPTNTQLTKTPLYGLFGDDGVLEEPAQLHRLFKDNLHVAMVEKYGKRPQPDIRFDKERDEYFNFLMKNSRVSCEPEIYTFEMAVFGDGEGLRSIDRSTSSGWPFNLNFKTSKKSYFFGKDVVHDVACPRALQLKQDCLDYETNLMNGIRIPQSYTDFPKDELYPSPKAMSGKIRLISASTFVMIISGRKYFGAFMSWFTRNCIMNGSAIGCDPYSGDWVALVRCLHSKGTAINAGDYKDYDAKHLTSVIWEVLNVIQTWYNDSHYKVRQGIFLEIVNSRHVFLGKTVQWNGGMPPGNVLTAVINTIANHLYIRKCYTLMKIPEPFDDKVFYVAQGDDNIWSVSDDLCDIFNEYTVVDVMATLGLTYTTEDKKANSSYRKRDITECEFLKRSFRTHEHLGRFVGPLRLSKTLALCYWTREHDTNILLDKMDVMSKELALAGEKTWNKYMPVLLAKWRSIRGSKGWPRFTTYESACGQLIF